jgi:putative endopeptidase
MILKRTAILSLIVVALETTAQNPGIKLNYIDSGASPKSDFYTYCNGKWQKNFVLPESDARYGSFNEINENNLKKIKVILDEASVNKTAVSNTNAQRLKDFYNTAMDTVKADRLGYKPISGLLSSIDKIKNLQEFMTVKAELEFSGVNLLFGTGSMPDLKNSKRHLFGINQAGMGLGDRDYYYSEKFTNIRTEYIRYLGDLFGLSGASSAESAKIAETVFGFEKKLADQSMTRLQMRDIEKMYNLYSRKTLHELTPVIDWTQQFKLKNITQPDTVVVGMIEFMKQVNVLLEHSPIDELKLYAKAHVLMEAAPFLSRKFVETHFNFRGKVMSGSKQMKPQWQRVQSTMNATIGDIVSEDFVKKYFPADAKAKINKLIDNLIAAYRERIATRDWMREETKKQANKKLDLLIRKIAYPDKWKDYTGLAIMTDSYWANMMRVNRWLNQDNLNELKKPVDRQKWQMTPVTVNAYYDPTTNEITFPAAIMQPPFYDPNVDDAANYGTMGSIIGHELTHGFDDQGSQFDAEGNMKMWWWSTDYTNFKEKTKLIIKQFDEYVAIDTLHVNGSMTQGENIADLGGLTMSYYAYKKSLGGKQSNVIGGYTGEQRFFIAWAQGWKSKCRDEELKRLLTMDYHSPAYFRAFAPLTNMKEFYEAFGVKPGDKMYVPEEKRVEIW